MKRNVDFFFVYFVLSTRSQLEAKPRTRRFKLGGDKTCAYVCTQYEQLKIMRLINTYLGNI